jgi:hypothetical protein
MIPRPALVTVCVMLAAASATAQQSLPDEILQLTRNWLKNASEGNRAGLNAIMDSRFIAVTPGGAILTKQELVPDDPEEAVQRLPAFEMAGPIVRVYGDTAVLMSSLTSGNQVLNGTFVYGKRDNAWSLVALHLSPQKFAQIWGRPAGPFWASPLATLSPVFYRSRRSGPGGPARTRASALPKVVTLSC